MQGLTHLDLFSGIGGFALGAQRAGIQTIAFSEINPFASKVLAKNFPSIPNLGDVRKLCRRTYDCEPIPDCFTEVYCPRCKTEFGECACIGTDQFTDTYGTPTIVTAGFPCQPFSLIGKQAGIDDPRNLWPEVSRILSELHPTWFIGENVPQFANVALDEVWADLESQGYEVQPFLLPACGVDARHKRERLWILGHANDAGPQGHPRDGISREGREEQDRPTGPAGIPPGRTQGWSTEPELGRVATRIPNRVDRLIGLGNSIVPQVAEQLFNLIKSCHQT